jgi:hypothetical protein
MANSRNGRVHRTCPFLTQSGRGLYRRRPLTEKNLFNEAA